MLKTFFKKEKPRVFLGSLAVAPRSDLKRHFDEYGMFKDADLDSSLRSSLEKIIDLPSMKDVKDLKPNDLALDIVIAKFQSGDSLDVSLGEFGFPLIWRPKIEIGARLFDIKSGKTIRAKTLTVKMPWKEYFSRLFTWQAFLRFKPIFDAKDMEKLLCIGCLELLTNLKKAV